MELKYNDKPIAQSVVTMSSKGQTIIMAEARKYLEKKKITKFTEKLFSDGSVLLTPIDDRTDEEKFNEQASVFFDNYGQISYEDDEETNMWLAMEDVGGEKYE
jgi:bifunctional DNA-binding transcriptional regulator/antitoxin component of YhaV-PrlF toxin-antitoxin module